MQRKISEFQTKSALALEQEKRKRREDELAFARRKCEEEARLESLRAEQEAAVAVARAKAIDKELGLNLDFQTIDLPIEDSNKRVQQFIDSQFEGLKRKKIIMKVILKQRTSPPAASQSRKRSPALRKSSIREHRPSILTLLTAWKVLFSFSPEGSSLLTK